MDRWADYRAQRLTAPAIVQHDVIGDEHLYWVWTGGTRIVGPLSRRGDKASEVLVIAAAVASVETVDAPVTDPRDVRIAALETENADLRRQIATRLIEDGRVR